MRMVCCSLMQITERWFFVFVSSGSRDLGSKGSGVWRMGAVRVSALSGIYALCFRVYNSGLSDNLGTLARNGSLATSG